MTNPNFTTILDEAPTEVVRPKPLPAGTYLFVVGAPRYDKSSRKQTEFTEFLLRPIQAMDDVDPDELEAAGGIDGKTIRATFYSTEDAIYRLDEFHEHCGIDLSQKASRRARSEECVNAQVIGVVRHRSSDDGQRVFAELAQTALAE